MKKQTIEYTSPIDALIAVTKRIGIYESQRGMDSEEFFDRYSRGLLSDEAVFVDWANDYRHYLRLRQELAKSLPDVDGFRPIPEGGSVVTNELVDELREELGV